MEYTYACLFSISVSIDNLVLHHKHANYYSCIYCHCLDSISEAIIYYIGQE